MNPVFTKINLLPSFAWAKIFRDSGELFTLSRVCRLFKVYADLVGIEVLSDLYKEYGEISVQMVRDTLGKKNTSILAQIDTLFHIAKTNPIFSPSRRSHAPSVDPYSSLHVAKIMEPFIKAQTLFQFFMAIFDDVPQSLKHQMAFAQFSEDAFVSMRQMSKLLLDNRAALAQVEALHLHGKNLKHLPPEIGLFENLKSLDLSNNELSSLPPEILHLKQLNVLNMNGNRCVLLPEEIGGLSSLTALYMADNKLNFLPQEIGRLSKLEILILSGNKLQGLPTAIGNLSALRQLSLESNRLYQLPNSIGDLKNLEHLHLYNNQLTRLPQTIGACEKLCILSAPHNSLVELPEEISGLKQLKILMLDNNQQLMELPDSLRQLENLYEVYVNENPKVLIPDIPSLQYLGYEGNVMLSSGSNFQFLADISRRSQAILLIPNVIKSEMVDKARFDSIYSGLGKMKWKECIDGVYHNFGPYVFDKGLHGKAVEPGFLDSMCKAFELLQGNFGRRVDADFYLELHKVACTHFNGLATQTSIGQDSIGRFRNMGVEANFPSPAYVMEKTAIEEFYALSTRLKCIFGPSFGLGYIEKIAEFPTTWRIVYQPLNREQVRMVFNLFVSEFYSEIVLSTTEEEKLLSIAKFIRNLEWLHPPLDGCGRTDTALLNFLLSTFGFTPVLLLSPYVSSVRGLMEWVEHVRWGMESWEKEARLNAPRADPNAQ